MVALAEQRGAQVQSGVSSRPDLSCQAPTEQELRSIAETILLTYAVAQEAAAEAAR